MSERGERPRALPPDRSEARVMTLPSVESLSARHRIACDLKQEIDRDKITRALGEFLREIGAPSQTSVVFVSSSKDVASAAWDASAASAAWAASAASAAWDTRAAWDASAAWDAWSASAARAAWDTSAAWDARAAWDATWISVTSIGAISLNDAATAKIWMPVLDAFEAGAFAFWITDGCVFVATIPAVVKVDSERRLHCETGPAFVWLDDIRDYYWRGAHVPAKWIEDRDSVSAADVFAEANAEKRRAGCEIIGWPRVLREIDATLIDDDGDPMIGTLYEGQIPGAVRCGFLKVLCGTGREFVIPVPSGRKTALAAQAWMQNVPVKDWIKPEVRG